MKLGAVVVCRMDSQRMPGKVLRCMHGRPLLWWILDRLSRTDASGGDGRMDAVVVATTARAADRPIAASVGEYRAWRERSLAVADERAREGSPAPVVFEYDGPVNDVSGRLLAAAEANGLDAFARINADSPFVEPRLLAKAAALLRGSTGGRSLEFVTNLAPRTYPYGVTAELIRTDAYRRTVARGAFEHPMQPVYEALDRLAWCNLPRDGPALDGLRMTVDTEADWERLLSATAAAGESWAERPYDAFVGAYADEAGVGVGAAVGAGFMGGTGGAT